MRKKFTQAATMQAKHETAYQQLKSTFSAELIKKWENRVEKWENDPKASNPYTEPSIGMKISLIVRHVSDGKNVGLTLQDVRLELSKEEALQGSSSNLQTQKISMTGFLTTGLELEDRQYVDTFHVSIAFLTNK